MRFSLLILVFLCSLYQSNAQSDTARSSTAANTVVRNVDVQAKFSGGPEAWGKFLSENLRANTPVKHKAPPGKYTVEVSFLVDTTGKVSEVQIDKDPGYGCGDEVYRIFTKKTPLWVPAIKNGQKVIYRQKQQLTFEVGSE